MGPKGRDTRARLAPGTAGTDCGHRLRAPITFLRAPHPRHGVHRSAGCSVVVSVRSQNMLGRLGLAAGAAWLGYAWLAHLATPLCVHRAPRAAGRRVALTF